MEQLLHNIHALKTELDGLPRKPENEQRLWQKFRLEWNYNSNHIEGNTLTYGETELLLFQDKIINPHDAREIDEMRAHDVAIEMVRSKAAEPDYPLTENDIRELNKIILVRPFYKDAQTPDGQPARKLITPGEYKRTPNSVRQKDGVIFEYVTPEETPIKMGELMGWYRTQTADFQPVQVAALLHYRLVRIHPFDDGNGRVCRLLMNYHLLRHGFPPVIIKSADKNRYLTALQRADMGDLEAFVKYIAEQLVWSLELAIRAAKGESVEEAEDWEKKLAILEKNSKARSETAPKSNEIIEMRYGDSIKPLISLLKEKVEPFSRFFHRQGIINRFWAIVDNQGSYSEDDLSVYFNKANAIVNEANWEFSWLHYKFEDSQPFSMSFILGIKFKEYRYHFLCSSIPSMEIEKPYNHPLTQSEITTFVNQIGAALTQELEAQIAAAAAQTPPAP